MRIGFIGLGAMGLPMTRNLLEAGHTVTVASRSRGPIDAAVGLGAVDGGDPAGVAGASDVILVCVPNSPEVVEVVDDLLPAAGPAPPGHRLLDDRSGRRTGAARAGDGRPARPIWTDRCRAGRWGPTRAR